MRERSAPSPSSIRSWIVAVGSRPKYVNTSPMSMSRSTTAVSWPVTSEIAVARLDVRNVLPVPPLEEKTDRIRPRVTGWPSVCGDVHRAEVGCPDDRALHGVAELLRPLGHVDDVADTRAHRRRQQPVPGVIADQHHGRPGGLAPDELGQAECVGLLDLGREDQDVDGLEGVDQQLLCSRGRLHPTHLVRAHLDGPGELLTERLRRPDGDDAGVGHPELAPIRSSSGTVEGGRLRALFVRRQEAEPHQSVLLREHEVLRVLRQGDRA